ncbi:MAG: acyltransferase [Ruminococcaceae bacterium]|nr:acyltransferase [Oscillospiraceae bacterium]
MEQKKHFDEIPLLTSILCLGVIIIHVTSLPLGTLAQTSLWYKLLFVINKFFVFCVPTFLFLSGFKLHNKYKNGIGVLSFYKNRIRKILCPYLVAVLLYYLYFLAKGWVSLASFPASVGLGTISAHFYYVIVSCQLYALFPLLLQALEKNDKLTLALSCIITVLFGQYLHFPYSDRFAGTYLFYFVLGMFVSKNDLYDKWKTGSALIWLLFLVVGAAHITLLYRFVCGKFFYGCAELVNMVYVLLSMVAIFRLCAVCKRFDFIRKAASRLNAQSYNIYLYHCLILSVVRYELFPKLCLAPKYEFLLLCALLAGAVTIYCLIPPAGKAKHKTIPL